MAHPFYIDAWGHELHIYSKNLAIHSATLDFKMVFNVIDSLDSKIKHLQRMMRNSLSRRNRTASLQSLRTQ